MKLNLISKNVFYIPSNYFYEISLKFHSDIFKKVQVYKERSTMLLEKTRYSDAVSSGLECLELLGISIPKEPSDSQVSQGNKSQNLDT